jgi:hypothetical protein
MRWISAVFIALFVACAVPAARAVDPIPESQQAPLALRVLDACRRTNQAAQPKKLYVVYFTPADREPVPKYGQRLEAILEDIRKFYRDGMERQGFGPKTFPLERDAKGKLIMHLVKGKKTKAAYANSWNNRFSVIGGECERMFQTSGI